MQRILGQLLRSLLQNLQNFSEVAPEVRPAVHAAPLHLIIANWLQMNYRATDLLYLRIDYQVAITDPQVLCRWS